MTAISVALIPAYRPDQTMLGILKQLNQEGLRSVVVDDGSGPDYLSLFEQAAFYGTVLRHDRNKGKGAALRTGLGYIQKQFCGEVINNPTANGRSIKERSVSDIVCIGYQ